MSVPPRSPSSVFWSLCTQQYMYAVWLLVTTSSSYRLLCQSHHVLRPLCSGLYAPSSTCMQFDCWSRLALAIDCYVSLLLQSLLVSFHRCMHQQDSVPQSDAGVWTHVGLMMPCSEYPHSVSCCIHSVSYYPVGVLCSECLCFCITRRIVWVYSW